MIKNLLIAVVAACSMAVGCIATESPGSDDDAEGPATNESQAPSSVGEELHPMYAPAGKMPPICECGGKVVCTGGKTCHMYAGGYCGVCG